MNESQETKTVSLQLAKNERIIKSFNYASFGYNKKLDKMQTTKRLVVTSRRIIHEVVCEERGNEQIIRREMPVEAAKYIDTVISKKLEPKYFTLAIVFGVLTLISVALALISSALFWVVAGGTLIASVVNLIFYYVKRSALVSCEIGIDHSITSAMSFLSYMNNNDATSEKKKNNSPSLKVYVNEEIALKLANELGAAILEATSSNTAISKK